MLLRNLGRLAAVAAALTCGIAAHAQDGGTVPAPVAADQAPVLGQVSKDSVWVPTPDHLIYRMLQLADTTPKDLVIDLGSGDGRIPIMAAKRFGARAIGVELETNLVRYSRESARKQGVAGRATFLQQDLFKADLSKATVIALYISPGVMTKLKSVFYDLKPGTRIVSHHFNLDDWEPDETLRAEQRSAHLWIVPEKVAGTWQLESGSDRLTVKLEQKFQELRGSAERGGKPAQLIGAKIRGRDIQFTIFDAEGNPRRYAGRADGGVMKGKSDGDKLESMPWRARRV